MDQTAVSVMQICYLGQHNGCDFLQRECILIASYAIHCRSCSKVLGKDGLNQNTHTRPWSVAIRNEKVKQFRDGCTDKTRPLAECTHPRPSKVTLTSKSNAGILLVKSSELPVGFKPLLLLYIKSTCNLFHLGQHLDKCGYQKGGYEGATADHVTHGAAFRYGRNRMK